MILPLSAGMAVAYCHDLSKEFCPCDFETSQAMLGEEILFITHWTSLFALSTEPWSRGVLGHPVTMKQFGLFFIMRSTTNCAINSFPLSVSKMLQRITNHKKLLLTKPK
jgi:hypothetical protein